MSLSSIWEGQKLTLPTLISVDGKIAFHGVTKQALHFQAGIVLATHAILGWYLAGTALKTLLTKY
jgi:hypothetical protein